MNPKLATLFEQYQFSRKDIYDFMQIYDLLPDYKKVGAIENFENIAKNISQLKSELLSEHEILFGKTLENIESRILKRRRESLIDSTQNRVQALKNTI